MVTFGESNCSDPYPNANSKVAVIHQISQVLTLIHHNKTKGDTTLWCSANQLSQVFCQLHASSVFHVCLKIRDSVRSLKVCTLDQTGKTGNLPNLNVNRNILKMMKNIRQHHPDLDKEKLGAHIISAVCQQPPDVKADRSYTVFFRLKQKI